MSSGLVLQKPLYGGPFGDGRYALASVPCISRGLYATRYMVVQQQEGAVLSIADDKAQALAGARRLLAANEPQTARGLGGVQGELWPDAPLLEQQPSAPVYVSRRRRAIFERSHGRCHYCDAALTLDGKWHVEHQLPRALGGDDTGLNLVAACVRCNLRKGPRSAIEFMADTQAVR
jgi:hypothetical protein